MAAKGSILKQEIASKILAAFPGSFLYNDGKEIRINGTENGESLQIKLTLTAAKVAVEGENSITLSGGAPVMDTKLNTVHENIPQEPSDEEKERLQMLLNKLAL